MSYLNNLISERKNELNGFEKYLLTIKNSFIKKSLVQKEKSQLHNKYRGDKLDNGGSIYETAKNNYLISGIYLTPGLSFLSKISSDELEQIKQSIIENFKYKFKNNRDIIRFYLVINNAYHLFEGYKKRLKFYNFFKKKNIKKLQIKFTNELFELINSEK